MKLFIITVKQKLCINQDFNHGYGVAITCRGFIVLDSKGTITETISLVKG